MICSCACWNVFPSNERLPACVAGATDVECLSLDGAGVVGWGGAAALRGRSVVSGVGVGGGTDRRGRGLPGIVGSSPGIGVAMAWYDLSR